MFSIYLSAFLLGIGSSLHCLGMCGPLVMAVPFGQQNKLASMMVYLSGKALAYALLGGLFGTLGLGLFLLRWQQMVSISAGIFIIVIALFPVLKMKHTGSVFQEKIIAVFSKVIRETKWYTKPLLGMLNGLLPCGMVYLALTTALASGHPLKGALAMLCFGIGTIPVLLSAMLFQSRLSLHMRLHLRPVMLGLSLLVGVLMILRGADLNVPYLSPHFEMQDTAIKGCCHQE